MEASYIELSGGEIAGMMPVEITSIPDVSIIAGKSGDGGDASKECIREYKRDFANLLSQIFQGYKLGKTASGFRDTSVEILWVTHPVSNQSYRAAIRLFMVIRAIDNDKVALEATLKGLYGTIAAALSLQKYEFEQVSQAAFLEAVSITRTESFTSLVKEESIAILQNQMLNQCYAYDRIPESEQDLSKIANVLVEYPECVVSFQLIPTMFTAAEGDCVDKMSTVLETLNKGVQDRMMGNVGFALAAKHAETYQYYSGNKNAALFAYNILVCGPTQAVENISNRIYGQVNGVSGKNVAMKTVTFGPNDFDLQNLVEPLPWALNEFLLSRDRNPSIWQPSNEAWMPFNRLPYVITAEEASEFFRLPIGTDRISAGLVVNSSGKNSKTYSSNIINGGDISVGKLKSSSHDDTIGFFLKDLTKHMLVVGTPGSGKTTFSVSLLDRLWKDHHIPFLVIEPAKNEYRALVQSIPDLQVFTPGKNFISPFQYNPFVPPKNVRLESYKSVLKTAFAAAVTMSSPLDKIFEEAINNCYSDFRWLDTYTSDDKGRVFNIQDFVKAFQQTFDTIGYTGDARNIGRAGVVRLQSLVNLFDNYYSIPIEDILSKPTIIELAAIENSDQKALIIALLLLSILSYVNRNYLGEGKLRNVILLEEAHVLLDSESKGGEGAADPSAIAKGLVKRMLAEIRSYGVGLVIADQSPRKVGTDVVALTNIKLSFRLVEREDKEILADSTNMSEVQVQRLARLKPGEAMLFFDKLEEPEEVKTEDYRAANNIAISLTDEGIRDSSTYWRDKQDKLKPYPECALVKTCPCTCDFAQRSLAKEIARRIYTHNFTKESKDFETLRTVFSRMTRLVKAELNDEPLTKGLVNCVKMQFLRKMKYATKIRLADAVIQKTLKSIKE